MKYTVIKGCLITILLAATVCNGFQQLILPDKYDALVHKLRRIRSVQDKLSETTTEPRSLTTEEISSVSSKESLESKTSYEVKDKRDAVNPVVNVTAAESRKGALSTPISPQDDPSNSDPDRIGFLFGLLPWLQYPFRPFRPSQPVKPPYPVHSRPPPYNPPPPPPIPYEPSGHPPPKPHPADFGLEPLPPFHADGPHFSDHEPHFPDHHGNDADDDFKPLPKPFDEDRPNWDHGGGVGFQHASFEFEFKPPDFFEHSGFPHPIEEDHFGHPGDHHELHDEPHDHPGDHHELHDEPHIDDHEHFGPPGPSYPSLEEHEPIIYTGPPKPPKFFSGPPKPHPPSPPKHPYPPDLNTVINENIYRDDIPVVEIHNEKDSIHDGLLHGGIKGLDQGDIDFIAVHTKPYVDQYHEFKET